MTVKAQAVSSPTMSATMKVLTTPAPAPLHTAAANPAATNGVVSAPPAPKVRHIWLVTGPAGCGKSTLAKYLADSLELPYLEGDDFHSQSNVDKMRHGEPLTDADRWDWLVALREASMRSLQEGAVGVVVTCSALKRKYRDVIRVAPYFIPDVQLHFLYLHAPESVLLERVTRRQDHYFGANMVRSQCAILEPPAEDERDVIAIDVTVEQDQICKDGLSKVLLAMTS